MYSYLPKFLNSVNFAVLNEAPPLTALYNNLYGSQLTRKLYPRIETVLAFTPRNFFSNSDKFVHCYTVKEQFLSFKEIS